MTANNASKLTHVYNSLKCIYEARYEDVGKPQAFAGMTYLSLCFGVTGHQA